jgi:putative oxidoreductase
MHINYPLLSRVLIALLFVVAGVQKIMGFDGTVTYVGSLGVPLPMIATILIIIAEIPVALAYAWGYKIRITGGILVGFTVIATFLAHRDIATGMNLIMALKNVAIIGGILATTGTCSCGRCEVLNPKK